MECDLKGWPVRGDGGDEGSSMRTFIRFWIFCFFTQKALLSWRGWRAFCLSSTTRVVVALSGPAVKPLFLVTRPVPNRACQANHIAFFFSPSPMFYFFLCPISSIYSGCLPRPALIPPPPFCFPLSPVSGTPLVGSTL